MTNQEALVLLINYCNQFRKDEIYAILDLKFRVVSSSELTGQVLGYQYRINDNTLVGKRVPQDLYMPEYRKNITLNAIQECVTTRKAVQILSFRMDREDRYKFLLITHKPIINSSTNQVIAVHSEGIIPKLPLYFYKIQEIVANPDFEQISANLIIKDSFLTPREHEVMFLLFFCHNYEEIAHVINLARGTRISTAAVAKTVQRNLYKKFATINLDSLKAAAHKLDYHKKIPPHLLGEFFFRLEDL